MTIISALLVFGALFVPESNDETLQVSPLARGEVTYISRGNCQAVIKVGSCGSRPISIIDETALHGYSYEYVPTEQTAVHIPYLTFDAANLAWKKSTVASNTTFVATVGVPAHYSIEDLTWTDSSVPESHIGSMRCDSSVFWDGNKATITFTVPHNGDINLSNFRVKINSLGYDGQVNDLTKLRVTLKDNLGYYNFAHLRQWILKREKNNLNSHWAYHPAMANIQADTRQMTYGPTNTFCCASNFTVSANTVVNKGLTIQRGARSAVDIMGGGTDYVATGSEKFKVTAITPSTNYVDITVVASNITNFALSNLRLHYSDEISMSYCNWREVSYTSAVGTLPNTYTLRVARDPNKPYGYYQVSYDSQYILVKVHGHIEAEVVKADEFQFKVGSTYTTIPNYIEYTLTNKTGTAITLNSGENGNLTLAANTAATINLVMPTDTTKGGDALLRVSAGAGAYISAITVNGSACTVEDVSGDALYMVRGVNYLSFTRTAVESGTSVIMVSRQVVVD